MDSRPAIEIDDLSFSYDSHPILWNISLDIQEGEFLAIIGPNGGGKTTLLKIILGLLSPDSGTVSVLGRSPEQARPRIGYVPQMQSGALDFPVSALEVALMGRLGHRPLFRRFDADDRSIAFDRLQRLGVDDLSSTRMSRLSGGQRQRVLIARALTGEPDILLLDEPAASVDPQNQESFYHLLEELNSRMTIVMVTHDVGAVASYVKTIACINVRLFSHAEELDHATLSQAYGCPIDLIAHGVPHRTFGPRKDLESSDD